MARSALHAAALICVLTATTSGNAAMNRDAAYDTTQPARPADSAARRDGARIDLGELLAEHGIAADSSKGRLIVAWIDRIVRDPAIAARIPGGTQRIEQIFTDADMRERFVAQGLAHLLPSDRFAYMTLLTRLFDEMVPVNCFGEANMSAIMAQVSLFDMNESDIDQYFGLLYRILANDPSSRPTPSPTPEQNEAAERAFSQSVVAQLRGDPTDIERFTQYATNPTSATPSDLCWATRVTMHAIIAMPPAQRDVVLLRTASPVSVRQAPASSRQDADAPR